MASHYVPLSKREKPISTMHQIPSSSSESPINKLSLIVVTFRPRKLPTGRPPLVREELALETDGCGGSRGAASCL